MKMQNIFSNIKLSLMELLNKIIGLLSGGDAALIKSVEDFED